MTKENYIKMTQPFRDHSGLARALHIANKLCTGMMYLSYPVLLLYLFFEGDSKLLKAVVVPAISFVVLTLIRKKINRKRPYEAFEVEPVIKKDTKGNSFPSRHVFSATIIALTFLFVSPWPMLGLLFLLVAVALAVVRVISGVHYISDVLAGMGFAILSAWIGYLI